ncbi:stealth conserved region 3 domain-containing protein [Pseudooceanicola sp.]|uniref:stealth conserved region 3 domain-containing protein n=1 Tax=Pseudooceanicola sp. TaxID=1914328 RepID=UPI0026172001|nr:stealth conserved region 3 domain-containing protein [Pseudooceanicola sp.]MDF1856031.1 stealth conserved region 3 domain-containing protein [Pseudooceanicola sp.]
MTATGRPTETGKIDVVYTWVDDRFEGYRETQSHYADLPADSSANRTRDNLDTLRYALRSLRHLPELGHVHILSCRPQVPAWLNVEAPGITVHHHDQVMDPAILPTFNSFAIVSHLHLLPGLSERFLYFEDDMLVNRPGLLAGLRDPDGRSVAHFSTRRVRTGAQLTQKDSAWNHALARAAAALDRSYGARERFHVIHGPKLIDKVNFAAMTDRFAAEIVTTRQSRFRSPQDVPPEFLYPQVAVAEGWARAATAAEARQMEGYIGVDNLLPWTWAKLQWNARANPITTTLNDNFGERPNPRVVAMMRRWLERQHPNPSPYERVSRAAS